MKCKHCGCAQVIKFGIRNEKQRFRCRSCKKVFQALYKYKGSIPKNTENIKDLVKEGLGIRNISRYLKISTNTTLKKIKEITSTIKKPVIFETHQKYQVDEMRTVTKTERADNEEDFIKEEIEDLIWCIEKNTIQNNRKGKNLIFATRSFRIATIGVAIFALIILPLSVSLNNDTQKIEIESINNSIVKEINLPVIEELGIIRNSTSGKNKKLDSLLLEINDKIDTLVSLD